MKRLARFLLITVMLAPLVGVACAGGSLPEAGRPSNFDLISAGQVRTGRIGDDSPYWLYGGSANINDTVADVRSRLDEAGWSNSPFRSRADGAAFTSHRDGKCLLFQDLKMDKGLTRSVRYWLEEDGRSDEVRAALEHQTAILILLIDCEFLVDSDAV